MHESLQRTTTEARLSLPDIALLVGTRVALGVGLGLLLAGHLSRSARKGAGAALLALGAISTIPLARKIAAGRGERERVPSNPTASEGVVAQPDKPNAGADKDRKAGDQDYLIKHSPSPNNPNNPNNR